MGHGDTCLPPPPWSLRMYANLAILIYIYSPKSSGRFFPFQPQIRRRWCILSQFRFPVYYVYVEMSIRLISWTRTHARRTCLKILATPLSLFVLSFSILSFSSKNLHSKRPLYWSLGWSSVMCYCRTCGMQRHKTQNVSDALKIWH